MKKVPGVFSDEIRAFDNNLWLMFWSPPALADRAFTGEAHRSRQCSVTLPADPSMASRFWPLPPVSSVNCTVPLLLR